MSKTKDKPKQKRGFAVMDRAAVLKIATMGGRAVSRNGAWMSKIGKLGGYRSGEVKQQRAISKLKKTVKKHCAAK